MIRLCAISTALLFANASVDAGIVDWVRGAFVRKESAEAPSIRVLLAQDQTNVDLEVRGKYKIFDPRTGEVIGLFQGKRRMLQPMRSGIRWGEEFPEVYQIAIVPDDPEGTITIDGEEYNGSLYVYHVEGTLNLVNKVSVEAYLGSILKSLYRDPLPKELMSAIAIVARTHAYYQAKMSANPYWDVDASIEAYAGAVSSRYYKGIEAAIRDTKYMVLNSAGEEECSTTLFASAWPTKNAAKLYKDRVYSLITLEAAGELARKGQNAPQILKKAFPNASIQLKSPAIEPKVEA